MGCPVLDHDADARVVHIIPIVTRAGDTEIAELGAGGGKGDLDQKEELDTNDAVDVAKLMELCTKTIKDPDTLANVLALLKRTLDSRAGAIDLDMDMQKASQEDEGAISLRTLVSALSSHASKNQDSEKRRNRSIRFPYSRHSSYHELCELVNAFKPKDVFPCTVDEDRWDPELGMRNLFGSFCSEDIFRHDAEMMPIYEARLEQESNAKRDRESQQETQCSEAHTMSPAAAKRPKLDGPPGGAISIEDGAESAPFFTSGEPMMTAHGAPSPTRTAEVPVTSPIPIPSETPSPVPRQPTPMELPPPTSTRALDSSILSMPSSRLTATPKTRSAQTPKASPSQKRTRTNKQIAYEAALGIHLTWADYGGLVSTKTKAEREEKEL
jgi:hypothetical protein